MSGLQRAAVGHWRHAGWPLALTLLACVGCEFQQVHAKGHGAAGKKLSVLAEADIGLERFHKLTPKQKEVADRIDWPFEKAALPQGEPKSEAKKLLEDVKKEWAKIQFIDVPKGKRWYFQARMKTAVGSFDFAFFESNAPEYVRNFVALVKAGAFKGSKLRFEGDQVTFAAAGGVPAPYSLQAHTMPAPVPRGALYYTVDGNRAPAWKFGMSSERTLKLQDKVVMFGRLTNANAAESFAAVRRGLAKTPDGVVIDEITLTTEPMELFRLDGLLLPERLDAAGFPVTSDLAMFTNASSPAPAADDHNHAPTPNAPPKAPEKK